MALPLDRIIRFLIIIPLYLYGDNQVGLQEMQKYRYDIRDNQRTIHLVISDVNLVRSVFENEMENQQFRWMYLGKDVLFDLKLRELAGPHRERINIAEEIQKNAWLYRDAYIQFVGDLMPKKDMMSWWLSNLSEKNPFVFNPFLAFCYIQSCLAAAERYHGDCVVVCQTRGLLLALEKNLESRGFHVKTLDHFLGGIITTISAYSVGFINLGWFGLTSLFRSAMAHLFMGIDSNRIRLVDIDPSWICIHSWVDNRTFKDGKSFSDTYFGNLGNDLGQKGYSVIYLADVLPTYSYLAAMKNIKQTRAPCILLEQFITPFDILRSFIQVRVPDVRSNAACIGDVDLSDIVRETLIVDQLDPRRKWAFLCYRAARKICSFSPPERFIYTFENHIWEKMFFLGFRQSCRKTGLVGYAHTIVNTMFTSYSLSLKERKIAPIPDRIIVNGIAAAHVLVNSGFSKDHIVVGGSLRYSHLWNATPQVKKYRDKTVVVIAASADIDDTIELLNQSSHAFGTNARYQVIVKCHPTVPYSLVAAGLPELPYNIIISEEPITCIIREADLLVYTSSASSVEAFALGLPIIHLKSEYRIDMNIFEKIPGIPSMTGDQLADTDLVSRSIDNYYEQFGNREKREDLLKTIFAPPSEELTLFFVSEINR